MVAQNCPVLATAARANPNQPQGPIRADRFKRACDLALGLGFLVSAAPVILALWVIVRVTSSGPGFYSQLRVGRGGRNYRIYKIRTMTHNCEAHSGAKWATKGDARVTPVGRILRKLHLDELPQLWNVIRGDMSLVGPRPERPEFVGPLSVEVEGYSERHCVRPGVTGLAQIQLPADSSVESVRAKLELDRLYIERAGFWLDLRIMLGTIVYLIGFSFATTRRLLRLPHPAPVTVSPVAPTEPVPAPAPTGDNTRDRVALGALKVVLNPEPATPPSESPAPVRGATR